jgi:uncharacterized protein (TIGR02001 family)
MQKKLLVAILGTLFAMPVLAEDAPAAAAAPTPAVTSNVSLVTNYLYRGISQTGGKPAIQGGFDYTHASGFYAGVWGSSISWIGDANIASNAGLELDTYFGFKNSFATDYSYDVGFLRYNYPGNYNGTTKVIGTTPFAKADTNEIYGALGYKWFTFKYSQSLGDTFSMPNASGTSYIDLSASYPVADTGFTLGAHAGRQSYKGATADALKAANFDPTYTDYKLSVTKDFSGYVVGLAYSNTNARSGGYYTTLINGNTNDLGKGTAVLSLTRTF